MEEEKLDCQVKVCSLQYFLANRADSNELVASICQKPMRSPFALFSMGTVHQVVVNEDSSPFQAMHTFPFVGGDLWPYFSSTPEGTTLEDYDLTRVGPVSFAMTRLMKNDSPGIEFRSNVFDTLVTELNRIHLGEERTGPISLGAPSTEPWFVLPDGVITKPEVDEGLSNASIVKLLHLNAQLLRVFGKQILYNCTELVLSECVEYRICSWSHPLIGIMILDMNFTFSELGPGKSFEVSDIFFIPSKTFDFIATSFYEQTLQTEFSVDLTKIEVHAVALPSENERLTELDLHLRWKFIIPLKQDQNKIPASQIQLGTVLETPLSISQLKNIREDREASYAFSKKKFVIIENEGPEKS